MPFVAAFVIAGTIIAAGMAIGGAALIGIGIAKTIDGYAKKKEAARRAALKLQRVQLTEITSETPRRVIYGRARVGGPIVFAHVTNNKRLLHLAIPFAWHEVDGFEHWLFDSRLVDVDANGWVARPDVAVTEIQEESIGIRSSSSASAGTYTVKIDGATFTVTTTSSKTPYELTKLIYDEIVGDAGYSAANYTAKSPTGWTPISGRWLVTESGEILYPKIILQQKAAVPGAEAFTTAFAIQYLDSPFVRENRTDLFLFREIDHDQTLAQLSQEEYDIIVLGQGGNLQRYPIQSDAQIITRQPTNPPPSAMISRIPGKWTSEHRMRGNAWAYVVLLWMDKRITQLPNIETILRGKPLHDPRDPSYPNDTARWSGTYDDADRDAGRNPALALLDYLLDTNYGLGVPVADIDLDSFRDAANVCDEDVFAYFRNNDPGQPVTEPRYTFDGVLEITGTHRDRIEPLLTAMAGRLYCHGGVYSVRAGAYSAPTVTLTVDDLRSGMQIRTRASGRDLINSVKGVYLSVPLNDRANSYQLTDFTPLTVRDWLTEDNDQYLWGEMEFPETTSAAMARRLAKISLERTRRQITVTFPAKLTALNIRAGDTVALTIARYGWTAKTFEVVESVIAGGKGDGEIGIDLTLQETDANIYAWATEFGVDYQSADAAPSTDLPNWATVAVPGTPVISESLHPSPSGVEAVAIVTWELASDGYVESYELQWRSAGALTWSPPVRVIGNRYNVGGLEGGTSYDFRVRARNTAGAFSIWSEQQNYQFAGLTAVPSDPSGLTIEPHEGLALLQWTLSDDLDVRIGGYFELRYQNVTTGAEWDAAEIVYDAIPGNSTSTLAPLRSGTWLLRAVDSSGNASGSTSVVLDAVPAFGGYQTLATEAEHTDGWSGTHSDTRVDSGDLTLGGGDLIDTWADVDSVESFDFVGGAATSGTYTVDWTGDDYYDLGAVHDFRLAFDLEWSRVDLLTLWDSMEDNIDTWPDVDGTGEQGTGNVTVEARTTDDDPAGTPTWTAWQTVTGPTDLRARAVQMRLTLSVAFVTHTVTVTEFTAYLYLPERSESGANVSISAGGTTVSFSDSFQAAPAVTAAIRSPSAGDYVDISAVTTTGFTVTVRNSGGTGIGKNIDWIARGYGRA